MHSIKVLSSILILIAIIIIASFWESKTLDSSSKKIEEQIKLATSYSINENWLEAKKHLSLLERDWSQISNSWTLLLDHIEIDNIENSLSRAKQYIEFKDKALALGELANLKQYVTHIPKKESFNLTNIF